MRLFILFFCHIMSSKTALIIGSVWPEPRSSAAGQHILSLIRLLQEIGLECVFTSAANNIEQSEGLAELGITTRQTWLNDSRFDELVDSLQPAVVLFDRFMTEEQFSWRVRRVCPDALLCLDSEDLHCLRYTRHTIIKSQLQQALDINALIKLNQQPGTFQGCLNSPEAQREIAAILRCDLTFIISRAELALLRDYYCIPEHILCYCPFLLSPSSPCVDDFASRRDFVFLGNYRHAPNWDAVQVLAQHIWPLIRAQLPHAQCHIYGAYTPDKAQQYHQPQRGIYVKGWACNAMQTLSKARVHLAPLRFGAGLKGKVFSAMQCGTPTVTTDIGSEGIDDMPEAQVVPGPLHVESFAEKAIALYRNQALWTKCNQHNQAILQTQFNMCEHHARITTQITSTLAHLTEHRATLFYRHMLESTAHRATQFMSQWIEAKQTIAELRESSPRPETD
jgi:O-antigen biosynthesis protein